MSNENPTLLELLLMAGAYEEEHTTTPEYTVTIPEDRLTAIQEALESPLRQQIERLQNAIRWYDDGENIDAGIEIVCWETLIKGDMEVTP